MRTNLIASSDMCLIPRYGGTESEEIHMRTTAKIRGALRPFGITSFHEETQKAQLIEQEETETRFAAFRSRQGKSNVHCQGNFQSSRRTPTGNSNGRGRRNTAPARHVCMTYEVSQPGRPYYRETGRCLKCRSTKHGFVTVPKLLRERI